jgi:hypothetical protein
VWLRAALMYAKLQHMKLRRKELLLFVIPVALLLVPLLLRRQPSDLLDKTMFEIAGPKAVDCGTVLVRGNRNAADACAVAAFKARRPFRLRYDTREGKIPNSYVGGYIASAYVGTPQGQAFYLHYLCAYWHGFRYNESVTYSGYKVIVKQRNGKQFLGLERKT